MSFDPLALPKVAAWRAGFGDAPDLLDYLGHEGSATLAVAFGALFWPAFEEHRGCVVLAAHFDAARFEEWWEQLDGDCAAIETTINHLHLWDVFDTASDDVPPEALRHLAGILAKTWRCALAEQFPGRAFAVDVSDEPDTYGPTLTVRSLPGD